LTILSYYQTGLSLKQVKTAIKALLSLGESDQSYHFEKCLDAVSLEERGDDFVKIDCFTKLDPTNTIQLNTLWKYCSKSMELYVFV
jgi:hypothetical protein